MEIVTVINTHGVPEITLDTLDSVLTYMTDKVLLVIDEAGYNLYEKLPLKVPILQGFYHNFNKAPYRNVILGLMMAQKTWPAADWYCYMEYDCLVGSAAFMKDLKTAANNNVWCIGNDYRVKQTANLRMAEAILQTSLPNKVYLLGACLFFHKKFINKMVQKDFFERFLFYTNDFQKGYFPGYEAHDILEHLLPTMAKAWGGGVTQFAKWVDTAGHWAGNYRKYPIRFRPELYPIEEEYLQAAIMHPLKSMDHPIREFHRSKREKCLKKK